MKVLFIHPNFPAQFRHVAAALGENSSNQVFFLTANPRPEWEIKGVRKIIYTIKKNSSENYIHHEHNERLLAGKAVLGKLHDLKKEGFQQKIGGGISSS